ERPALRNRGRQPQRRPRMQVRISAWIDLPSQASQDRGAYRPKTVPHFVPRLGRKQSQTEADQGASEPLPPDKRPRVCRVQFGLFWVLHSLLRANFLSASLSVEAPRRCRGGGA